MNNLKKINEFGQSIWLDFFDREIMNNGKLQSLIDDDGLSGITSNPSIFEKAITATSDYDEDVKKLSKTGKTNEEIFFEIAIDDIKRATKILEPVYDKSNGTDGFVSLEVSPLIANDTNATIKQARDLWNRVGRKNVMIKIPATTAGIPAIEQCLTEGININITLLFGLEMYREVANAYLKALENRLNKNESIENVSSVASFFLSRIDVISKEPLEKNGMADMYGKIAIDSAKIAYEIFEEIFNSERFMNLKNKGAKPQKVLWASTSTKDDNFSDVKYVEALIGKDTINTLPMETIDAFRDHGKAGSTIKDGVEQAHKDLALLQMKGVSLDKLTTELIKEGVEKFNDAYNKLLAAIDKKS